MSNTVAWLVFSLICGIGSLSLGSYLFYWVSKQDDGTDRSREVARWIHEGAQAYLKKLYTALIIVAAIMAVFLFVVYSIEHGRGLETAICYLIGAICSAAAGYMGM